MKYRGFADDEAFKAAHVTAFISWCIALS